jgi:hypothetical protein
MKQMSNKVGNVSRRITSGAFAFLLPLDFKFVNKSKTTTENVGMLIVPVHVAHSSQYKISPYLKGTITFDYNRCLQ